MHSIVNSTNNLVKQEYGYVAGSGYRWGFWVCVCVCVCACVLTYVCWQAENTYFMLRGQDFVLNQDSPRTVVSTVQECPTMCNLAHAVWSSPFATQRSPTCKTGTEVKPSFAISLQGNRAHYDGSSCNYAEDLFLPSMAWKKKECCQYK